MIEHDWEKCFQCKLNWFCVLCLKFGKSKRSLFCFFQNLDLSTLHCNCEQKLAQQQLKMCMYVQIGKDKIVQGLTFLFDFHSQDSILWIQLMLLIFYKVQMLLLSSLLMTASSSDFEQIQLVKNCPIQLSRKISILSAVRCECHGI